MNEDLGVFEKELKALFVDVPLPESLEAGRVAEALKKPRVEIKVASPPWKRALRIAAAVALVAGAAIISLLALRQRAGNSIATDESSEDPFFTQTTVSSDEAGAGVGETEAGVIEAPETAQADTFATSGEAKLSVASDASGVPMPTGLDEAVSAAIMSENSAASADARAAVFAVEAHRVLGSADGETTVTVYAATLYCEYTADESGAMVLSRGVNNPAAMTFDKLESGYALTEYLVPAAGATYPEALNEIFPAEIYDLALANDDGALQAECDAAADAHFAEGAGS